MTNHDAIKRAAQIVGGQAALARKIGASRSLIGYWINDSKRGVPAEYVHAVSKATGVPKRELRPDLYDAQQRAS